ncbi:MAG TPA: MarR family winged helix-turn-helix transcriptional regulator [Candidatus Saccharimonadales bacterium]
MNPNDSPQAAITYLLEHVPSVLMRQSDQTLQEQLGIGMSQLRILVLLQKQPELLQNQIAEHLGQTEASISRQMRIMHEKGLLTRRVDPNNRRAHLTEPTPKGLKLAEAANAALLRHTTPTLAALNDKQQKQLVEMLRLMHDAVCAPGKITSCDHPFGL